MANKRGRPPKNLPPQEPWYKKAWVKVTAIIGFIIAALSAFSDVPAGWDNLKGWVGSAFTKEIPKKDSVLVCSFPKKFQKDTLYVLVTRFEDDIEKIESKCYGRSLQSRIDQIREQKKIPLRVCYNENIAINTIDEAKRVQKEYNADVVFYGTIRNIKESCMA